MQPLRSLYMHLQNGGGADDHLNQGIMAGIGSVTNAHGHVTRMASGGATHVSGPMTSSPAPRGRDFAPSTGNSVADARIAAGDQRVINNVRAAAMYAAQDNARNGTPIPNSLKGFVPAAGGGSGGSSKPGIGGYTGLWDMINGGGPGASRWGANPATPAAAGEDHPRGLMAIFNDLSMGGIPALLNDATNGGGMGTSGTRFNGGLRAGILNTLGVPPRGQPGSPFGGPETLPTAGGTEATVATGMAAGGRTDGAPKGNEKDLISNAVAAIKGQVQDPRPILGAFLAKYGETALRDLVHKVESGAVDDTARRSEGRINGPGDGMDDRVPAKVQNGHDVLLANDEYIVPADVVSALGNGSSDAGASKLDDMLSRVRTAAHGKDTQQNKVHDAKVLPA